MHAYTYQRSFWTFPGQFKSGVLNSSLIIMFPIFAILFSFHIFKVYAVDCIISNGKQKNSRKIYPSREDSSSCDTSCLSEKMIPSQSSLHCPLHILSKVSEFFISDLKHREPRKSQSTIGASGMKCKTTTKQFCSFIGLTQLFESEII